MKLLVYQFSNFTKSVRLLLGLVLGLSQFFHAFSQTRELDSLNKMLNTTSVRTEKVDLLYQLAYQYIFSDLSEALKNARLSQQLALEIGDSLRIVKASLVISSAFRRLEQIDSAIKAAEFGLEISTRNNFLSERKILLNSLAVAHSLKAEYDRALDFHFQSLILREETGTKSEVSITLNNIGFVYFKLKNYEKALEYYLRSLKLKLSENDLHDLDRLYINIGLCNIHLKNFQEALKSINAGFGICGNNCSDEIVVEGEFGRGVANFNLQNYEQAEGHFKVSYELAQRLDFKRWMAENLVYLARLAITTNRLPEAKEYLLQGEEIARAYKYNQLLLDSYREFSNLYNLSRDFQNASVYQNQYINLKDSLIGEELVKNIARTQTQFEERENIKTIALKEEALSRQRMLNLAIGTIAFLAALLVFVLFQSNKVKRRVNAKLSDANAIIAEQNKQLQQHSNTLQAEVNKATADLLISNQALDNVNKELDNFIYKTSHDIRGPLASLKGMCNVALIDVKDELALDYLRKLDVTATKLNRILTRLLIINQINNATPNPEPLDIDLIVDDIIRFESKKGLPADFTFKREIQRNMNIKSDDALIRIIIENLIDNAVKFYNDSERIQPFALIRIYTDEKNLNIHVIDNGVGISSVQPDKIFQMFTRASEKSGTGGLGLYLIKQASTRLGGDVGLRLTPESFTEFYVTLPLKIPEALLEKKEDNKMVPPPVQV